jgi:hypothetical protein
MMASLPGMQAYYAVPVRQASDLLSASFRFHLAIDTLAAPLMIPLNGLIVNFHHQVKAPCRAHHSKSIPALGFKDAFS